MKTIQNIEIDGFDLMLEFKKQVTELQVPIIEDNLKSVSKTEKGFLCKLNNGQEIETKTVILAIGRERRKLGLENEDEWTGKGVSYCSTCDAPLYKNKNLAVVVGGGNAAVEGAILIAKYAKRYSWFIEEKNYGDQNLYCLKHLIKLKMWTYY